MARAAIEASGLGKRYRIGTRSPYRTLRETLSGAFTAAVPAARGRRGGDALGAAGRRLPGRARGEGRDHRPQRRRQEHAAQGARADHRPDRGRGAGARPGRQPAGGRHRIPPGADRPREHLSERRDPRHARRRGATASSTRSWPSPRSSASSTRRSSATRAGCTCGSRSPSPPTSSRRSCSSTRCSRSATRRSRRSAWARWRRSGRQGRTVLFVSHNMGLITSLASRGVWSSRPAACVFDGAHGGRSSARTSRGSGPAWRPGCRCAAIPNRLPGMRTVITGAACLQDDGSPAATFLQSDDVVLDLDYDAGDGLPLAGAGFIVYTTSGVRVGATTPTWPVRRRTGSRPRGRCASRSPRRQFMPGSYCVTVSVGSHPGDARGQGGDPRSGSTIHPSDIYGTGYLLSPDDGVAAIVAGHGGCHVARPGRGRAMNGPTGGIVLIARYLRDADETGPPALPPGLGYVARSAECGGDSLRGQRPRARERRRGLEERLAEVPAARSLASAC